VGFDGSDIDAFCRSFTHRSTVAACSTASLPRSGISAFCQQK
jgi:hypothetical protein